MGNGGLGQYYSQEAWNKLLTKSCEGYPLTEIEMNVLGLAQVANEGPPKREYVEQNCGALSKLAYMIVNDLKEFGFLSLNEQDRLMITPRGEKALQGIARRMYDRKFNANMLFVNQANSSRPTLERAQKKEENEQAKLF